MPDVAAFTASYPDIDMEIIHSYRTFDLSKREADIAIRFVRFGTQPPEHLIGRRVATSFSANYASAPFLDRMDEAADPPIGQWIGWEDQVRFPKWVLESDHPRLPVRSRMPDVVMQLRAAKNGMGIAVLPCFVGDAQPDLLRGPPTEPYSAYDIWILSHPDLRETARLRRFANSSARPSPSTRTCSKAAGPIGPRAELRRGYLSRRCSDIDKFGTCWCEIGPTGRALASR